MRLCYFSFTKICPTKPTIITVLPVEKGQLFDTGQIVKVGMVLHADFASTEVH